MALIRYPELQNLRAAVRGQLLERQGNQCAGCGIDDPGNGKTGWHLDHCHESGFVRGVLCSGCNQAAGCVGDSPARLRALADYLDAFAQRREDEHEEVEGTPEALGFAAVDGVWRVRQDGWTGAAYETIQTTIITKPPPSLRRGRKREDGRAPRR